MSLYQSSSTGAGAVSSGSAFSGGIGGSESRRFWEQNNDMRSSKLVMIAQDLISALAMRQQYAKIGRNASVSQVKSASASTYWVSFVTIDLRPACV